MPDIITAAEQDAIAAFFAAGGEITKLPPCCMVLEGAVPREEIVGQEEKRVTYKTHDSLGRKVGGWHEALPEKPKESDSASRNEDRAKARAIEQAKAKRNRLKSGHAGVRETLERKTKARMFKALRLIGGDWSKDHLALVAMRMGSSYRSFTRWMREHGHGDRLPQKPKVDTAERDYLVCRDYRNMVATSVICATYGISARTMRRIVKADGQELRGDITQRKATKPKPKRAHKPVKVKPTKPEKPKKAATPPLPKRDIAAAKAERDKMIRADYEAGMPGPELYAKYNLKRDAIRRAVRMAGGSVRDRIGTPRRDFERDALVVAERKAGKSMRQIKTEHGIAHATIHNILTRHGLETNSRKVRHG